MTSPFQAPPEHLLRREPTAREKAAARLRELRPGAARLADAGFAAALVLVALLGLRTTYDGWLWLVPGVVGLVLGVVVTHVVLAWRLPGIVAALVLTVLYLLLGGAVATRDDLLWGVLPTGATLTELARTAVLGWKQLLTSLPPIDSRGALMALPLLLGLVGGALVHGPAARWRLPAVAVPAPLALLTISLLLGTSQPAGVLVMGLGSGLLLVGWVALRGRFARPSVDHGTVGTDRTAATWRVATSGVLLLLAGTGGWLLGPGLPGDDGGRTIWRTALVPPYDVSQFPSPLAGYRKYTEPNPAKLYDRTLFTVTGLPAGTPVRLATLDSYDGSVWGAGTTAATAGDGGDDGAGASGSSSDGATFQRVGSHIAASGDGTPRTVTVTIPDQGWSDVWLPTVGTVTGVRFAGPGGDALGDDLRFNVDTDTGIVPAGLQAGDRYTLEADVPSTPSTLPKDLDVAGGSIIDTQAVGFTDDKVATWTANITSPWQRFTAVARAMASDGAYTDGGTPGSYQNVFLPGHSLSRMTRFFKSTQLAGDDEQYASALALVGNRIGVPTRVVLGAIPEGSGDRLSVKGKDVHAWVEVQTQDGGWYPVLPRDFVPDRNKQPQQQQQRSEEKKVGAQVPPPVSANPPSVLQGPDQSQNSTNVKRPSKPNPLDPSQWPAWLRWLVLGVGAPVLVLGLLYLGLRLAKRRRATRRRTRGSMPDRVAGGWAEIVDTAQDLGMPLAPRLTRLEQATVLDALLASSGARHPQGDAGRRAGRRRDARRAGGGAARADPPRRATRVGARHDALVAASAGRHRQRSRLRRGRPDTAAGRRLLGPGRRRHPTAATARLAAPAAAQRRQPRRVAQGPPGAGRPRRGRLTSRGAHGARRPAAEPPRRGRGHRVKLKFTLRSGTGETDLVATVDATATVGDLAAHLALADPARGAGGYATPVGEMTLSLEDGDHRSLDPRTTIGDSGLFSGSVVSLTRAGGAYVDAGRTAATVVIVAGPDEGREFPLPRGTAYIGRGRGCEVALSDASVSRRHARLVLTDVAEIVDLGSANGLTAGGQQVTRMTLRGGGDVIRLGDTALQVRLTGADGAAAPGTGVLGTEGGTVSYSRSPRVLPVVEGRPFEVPELPERPGKQAFPWIQLLVPVFMAVVLYAITKSFLSFIFLAMMPLLVVGNSWDQRRQGRKLFEQAMTEFGEDLDVLVAGIRAEHERERVGRLAEHPAGTEVLAAADARGPLLWTRRPDDDAFLTLRLGLGSQPSRSTLTMPKVGRSKAEAWLMVSERMAGLDRVDGVPVVADPLAHGAIGVCGPRPAALGAARSLVLQAAGLHSPADLVLVAFASVGAAQDWDFLKWLPHTSSAHSPLGARTLASSGPACSVLADELEDLVEARAGQDGPRGDAAAATPRVLVLVEGDAPVERARLVEIAERGAAVGVVVLWVAPRQELLPAACSTFLVAGDDAPLVGYVHEGESVQPVQVDAVSAQERGVRRPSAGPRRRLRRRGAGRLRPAARRVVPRAQRDGDRQQPTPPQVERWVESRSVLTGPFAPTTPYRRPGNLRAVVGQSGQGAADPRPAQRRPARPRRRHHRCRQVRAAAGVDPRDGGGAQPAAGDLPARRLQGRLGVPRLRQPAAHRRSGHRPVARTSCGGRWTSLSAELRYREHLLARHKAKDLVELRAAWRGRGPAQPGHRRRRVRGAGQRGARVRRRRRQRRPARSLARAAPHPRHPAPGRRHQGQPAGQHQPADGAADGRRGRQRRRARLDRGGVLRARPARPGDGQDRPRPADAVPDRRTPAGGPRTPRRPPS